MEEYFNGHQQNIGLLLGQASENLQDADSDAPEAVIAGASFLPKTGWVSGRRSKPRSHRFYRTTEPLEPRQFHDINDDRTMLFELRSTGQQTIVPPSTHPEGEPIVWYAFDEPATVAHTDLERAATYTAIAAIIARHWPSGPGIRHELAKAWAGYLLRRGIGPDDVSTILETVVSIRDDPSEMRDRLAAVRTTVRKLAAGEKVTGGRKLTELLPETGEKLLSRIKEWLDPIHAGIGVDVTHPVRHEPPSVPSLTPDLIPEPLRPWIQDSAALRCVPLEYSACAAIAALSAVVGRSAGICPDRYSPYLVVPTLWGALVARPGEFKTPVINDALAPLKRLEAEARERYEEEAKELEPKRKRLQAQIEGTEQAIKAAAKRGNAESCDELEGHLGQMLREIDSLQTTPKRYTTQDATVEKLGELLRDNPRGILLYRDELSGWLAALERQGKEGDREFYLEAWNGTGSFTFDRIARGTVYIPALTLSVFGGIQPGKIARHVRAAEEGGAGDDGLLQRFQLLVFPDRLPDWDPPHRWPDAAAKDRAFDLFKALDTLDPAARGAVGDGDVCPYFRFSVDAQERYEEWRGRLENRLRGGSLDSCPAFAAHLAKYRSLVPSLALLFHLVDMEDRKASGPVSVDALEMSLDWAEFLEAHARKLYADEVAAEATKLLTFEDQLVETLLGLGAQAENGRLPVSLITKAHNVCWGGKVSAKSIGRCLRRLGINDGVTTESGLAAILWNVSREAELKARQRPSVSGVSGLSGVSEQQPQNETGGKEDTEDSEVKATGPLDFTEYESIPAHHQSSSPVESQETPETPERPPERCKCGRLYIVYADGTRRCDRCGAIVEWMPF